MWQRVKVFTSKVESVVQFGEYYDYKAPLEYLTGYRKFRGGQAAAYRAMRQGHDVLFVAPTGIGKSVTFQLPGLLAKHPTLVISPLKALMRDQVQNLWQRYIPSTYINGDLSDNEIVKRISFISKRMLKFVYVAPERYFKSKNSKSIFTQKYDIFVVDEAHCIDKWGGNFRQSYSRLGDIRKAIGSPQTIAVTASASRKTQDAIVESLGLDNPVRIVKGFYRPNITIETNTEGREKIDKLLHLIQAGYIPVDGKTIFYVATVKEGIKLKGVLKLQHIDTDFYHGKLPAEERSIIQDKFKNNGKCIISTSAFGMGIDIPDIRLVVHWNVPGTIEDYYQQIGRAGRDGELSRAILLYSPGDEGLVRYIATKPIEISTSLSADEKRLALNRVDIEIREVVKLANSDNAWAYILNYFGEQGALSKLTIFWGYILTIASNIHRFINRNA